MGARSGLLERLVLPFVDEAVQHHWRRGQLLRVVEEVMVFRPKMGRPIRNLQDLPVATTFHYAPRAHHSANKLCLCV